MFIPKITITAVAAYFLVTETANLKFSRKYTKTIERNIELQNLAVVHKKQIRYLVDMINRNDIAMTDFDRIALTDIQES